MHAVHGIYDGETIRPLEPLHARPNARVVITVIDPPPSGDLPVTRLDDVAGCLHYDGPAKTLADMDAAIQKGVAARLK